MGDDGKPTPQSEDEARSDTAPRDRDPSTGATKDAPGGSEPAEGSPYDKAPGPAQQPS